MLDFWLNFFESTLRSATPLIFAALGGLYCERSGITNIALEGMMLLGAFVAGAVAFLFASPWLGLVGAVASGVASAILFGVMAIHLRANQIVAATAINMLALGIPPFACKILFGQSGGTPPLEVAQRFGGTGPVISVIFCVAITWYLLKYTRFGLWLTFAGEHPESLATAGVSVIKVRWTAVILSGILASIGGMTLSISLSSSFTRDMSAGRGFMALAALIMGKWNPIGAFISCLLFGAASALEMRLQGVPIWNGQPIPVQFIQILPYVLTVLVLAGVVGRSRAPAALGR